jgi:hypothetical protein
MGLPSPSLAVSRQTARHLNVTEKTRDSIAERPENLADLVKMVNSAELVKVSET